MTAFLKEEEKYSLHVLNENEFLKLLYYTDDCIKEKKTNYFHITKN